jgi:predicted amidohydrolase
MTSKKMMRVLSLQLPSTKSYRENLDKLLEFIELHRDRELIVAPEVYLTAYDYPNIQEAAKFSAEALEILKGKISDQILVITLILKDGDSFINRAVVIHDHQVVYQQDKAKLFKLGDEDKYLKSGDIEDIKPFEIDGVKYALLICFELRFKYLWREIEGVDIILVPARWGLPRKAHLEILSKALAIINQSFLVLSNSSDKDMASSSAIISPNGDAIVDDSSSEIAGEIEFSQIKKMRRYIIMD